jgi:hypothetical protein
MSPVSDELSLGQIADALVGVESTELLLNRIETVLQRVQAVPARLWLMDVGEMVFYCVAGFGCPRDVDDLPAEEILMEPQAGQYALHQNGDPIGMLQVLEGGETSTPSIVWCRFWGRCSSV